MARRAFPFALIIIFGIITYANSINGEFVYDDIGLVRDNVYITRSSYIPKAFTEDIFSGSGAKSSFYRPLQMISYTIDHIFWKKESRGYHITNIALHILVALSVYWFICIMFQNGLLSLFAGLLFVVHPIHTEAVSYIAGRADMLAAFFMLLCLIFYIKRLRLVTVLCYTAALLSKETALILPALMLLYNHRDGSEVEYRPVPKGDRPIFNFRTVPIFIVTGVYITLRLTLFRAFFDSMPSTTTLIQRIPGFFVAITNYMRLLIAPFGLHMEYAEPPFSMGHPKAIFGALVVLFLLACAIRTRKNNRLIFFSIMWFFIGLIPVSNLYPLNAHMAEHWLYLPSVGFFIVAAWGILSFWPRKKYISVLFLAALLGFYSILTIKQNRHWQDPAAFWENTSKYSLGSARVYSNMAINHARRGEYEKAIILFKKAMKADPEFEEAYSNLGNVYHSIGKDREAEALYKKAINIEPNYAKAYNNLATLYISTGRSFESVSLYTKAINIDPVYTDAYYNLGVVYQDMGRMDKAVLNYKKALELKPEHAKAHNNLAVIYFDKGEIELARAHCKAATGLGYKVNPGFLKKLEKK